MKVVIAGAGGQLGRALLSCVPETATVVGLTRAELDIGDAAAVMRLTRSLRPDLIICAAAYTAVDRAESQPELAALVNVDGARNLALAALESGARLLHVSTDFVFDGLASTPYPPQARTNPRNVYGKTKLGGELEIRRIMPQRSAIVRTSWLYAAEGNNFLRTMMRLMGAKGHVRVVSDQVGSPTAARSVARVLWALAGRSDLQGVYHWADAGVASWYDFAVAIAEEAAAVALLPEQIRIDPITTDEFPTPAQRPPFSVLDSHALHAALSLTPCHWRTQLRSVIREMAHA
jgi:dTDP-4-dehydrorhamnose reductase